MRLAWCLGERCEEISVRLLSTADDGNYAVEILCERTTFVHCLWISLEQIARTFDGLVWVGIIESESPTLIRKLLSRIHQMLVGIAEIGVTACLLTFREGKRDGHFAARSETLAPETFAHLDRCERHRRDRIPWDLALSHHVACQERAGNCVQKSFHCYDV